MFNNAEEVIKYLADEDVKFVDVRFCDLPGVMQHFNVPAKSVNADFFTDGQMFDGSSIRGFQAIHESDMKMIPDLDTAYIDPFRTEKTLNINMSIVDPYTDEPYSRDPRQVAFKAEAYLRSTGIADTAFFAPEAEFYIFDDVRFETKQSASYYYIDSIEAAWNTGRVEDGGNRGHKTPYKAGTSRSRRSTTTPTCVTRCASSSTRSASTWSARTTRSAPPARPRSTTGSTRCASRPTRCSCSSTS